MPFRPWLVIALLIAAACTQAEPTTGPPATSGPVSPGSSPGDEPGRAVLADGSPLPTGCGGASPRAGQTVAFVSGGRAWALHPGSGRLTCMFEVGDPGLFAWGPRGDRVLLAGLEVRGVALGALDHPITGEALDVLDWGHPVGTAIVFASDDQTRPKKLYLEEDRIADLRRLPRGMYVDVAYHPSGLAIGFILERGGRRSIWISTNEGLEPERLVFSKSGTRFTSIEFTPDGRELVWIAQHPNDYPQIHAMDLADRSGFTNGWQGEVGQEVGDLRLAPIGDVHTVNEGASCESSRAMVVAGNEARPLLPDETRPTAALGWLDGTTVLASAGGCGPTLDLFAIDLTENDPALLVSGVEVAASRAKAPPGPDAVPVPAEEEPPPGGVG